MELNRIKFKIELNRTCARSTAGSLGGTDTESASQHRFGFRNSVPKPTLHHSGWRARLAETMPLSALALALRLAVLPPLLGLLLLAMLLMAQSRLMPCLLRLLQLDLPTAAATHHFGSA